ncbi:putative C6 transcription factor RegA [Bipolaris maydis]|nr:putative C6 transcription factor RegA [Bipolaris maydis]KAJ6204988.1 putative C6 transcription factor RegA [Bipolaris maydis]
MSTTQEAVPETISTVGGLFQCTICSQTYSRVDHLARHVRSHTQEKPYRCEICNKSFSRVDLLRRHGLVHGAAGNDFSKKRRRVSPGPSTPVRACRACEACAEQHLKCGDDKPCGRCRRKNINCVVGPRLTNVTLEVTNSPRISPPRIEPESSMQAQLQNVAMGDENVTQSIYRNHEALNSAVLDQAPGYSIPPRELSDQLLSEQSQAVTETENVPPKEIHTLPSSTLFPALPNGALTPNRLFGFGVQSDLDFSALDLSFLDTYNTRVPFEFEIRSLHTPEQDTNSPEHHQMQNPDGRNKTTLREAQKQSTWRFVPVPTDSRFAEHANLSLPNQDTMVDSPQSFGDLPQRATKEKLDPESRDKILAVVLSQMRTHTNSPLSAFPSVDLLDNLIQFFLASSVLKASSWMHCASFHLRQARPELLLGMAAYGAVLTPDHALRKLGYATQEIVRSHLLTVFEEDNTLIHDLQLQQAFLMHLEIGLWSGNSRKMELSESSLQPLLTMLRRRGFLKRSGYPNLTVLPNDEGLVLDKKWREWVGRESRKRLVYAVCAYDAQSSISLLVSPLVSYAELDLPLPESQELWSAVSAVEWKRLYCQRPDHTSMRLPSLNDCVANLDLLELNRATIDLSLSCSAILYALWGLIWEYRKISLLFCRQPRVWDRGVAILSRHQELTKVLDYYRMKFGGENLLLLELISMHLHMSLEEIQLFVGLEGIEQADRVYESVKEWVGNKTSRQAVWHAGQVFRATKSLPPLHLRDFYAICLFHVSLTFWAYGLASRMFGPDASGQNTSESASFRHLLDQIIWLDGEETAATYRYISLGIGNPGLQGTHQHRAPARLNDLSAIMDVIIETMSNHDREPLRPNPPLVENLISIMERLKNMTLGDGVATTPNRTSNNQ